MRKQFYIAVLIFFSVLKCMAQEHTLDSLKSRLQNNLQNGGNKTEAVIQLKAMGAIYTELKQFSEAERSMLQAIALSDSIGYLEGSAEANRNLSALYSSLGKYEPAFKHYKRFVAADDSLYNEKKSQDLGRLEAKHEFEKQQAITQAEHKKELELASEREKLQQIINYSAAGGLVLVVVFAFSVYNRFRVARRQKAIIEEQKLIVEEKQKEIIDSITYARRIQQSLFPTEKYFSKNLPSLNK